MNICDALILIVDDDEIIRLTIRNALRQLGCKTIEAANGEDGLQSFLANNPDLVIIDMLMPVKEGLETIADIRAASPKTPIIAVSGGGHPHDTAFLQLARELGAVRTLTKPIRADQLRNAVTKALR